MKKKTVRKYFLGVGQKEFDFDSIQERTKAIKIVKAAKVKYSTWHQDVEIKPKKKSTPKVKVTPMSEMKYRYSVSVLKSSEGGPGTADIKRSFERRPIEGVRTFFHGGGYVGHSEVAVYATNLKTLKEAARRLVDFGHSDSVKEIIEWSTIHGRI